MAIEQHEIEIIGKGLFVAGKMVNDENAKRVYALTSNYLVKLCTSKSGWEILYQDPQDGRYWELRYTLSEMHGGGPPSLFNVGKAYVVDNYSDSSISGLSL